MFGFSQEYETKKNILFYLDKQEESIPSQEMTEAVGNVTNQTIRKYLLEIREDMSKLYPSDRMRLEINRRSGIQLIRQNTNFDRLIEEIYKDSIIYDIFRQLVEKRHFETQPFCEEHGISLSNLRRKVKDISGSLKSEKVHLSIGRQVRIAGDEASIRLIFFSFYYAIHRGITSIDFIDSREVLEQGAKICRYLYLEPTSTRIDLLALWLFINQKAIQNNHLLGKNTVVKEFETKIMVPSFLEAFEKEDWHFFLAILQGLELIVMDETENFEAEHDNKFSEATHCWIELFENQFMALDIVSKENLTKMMYKSVVLDSVWPLAGELYTFFISVDEAELQELYPTFMSTFDQFWTDFTRKHPEMDNLFMRKRSLLYSFKFISDSQLIPTFSVYLYSNLPVIKQDQIKRYLVNRLKNEADLVFVDKVKSADLIFQTEDNAKLTNDPSHLVTLSREVTHQDVAAIKRVIKTLEK